MDRLDGYDMSVARRERVLNAYKRYWGNMSKTRQFQKDDAAQVKAMISGNRVEYRRAKDVLENRQYSRNTYMGLSNG